MVGKKYIAYVLLAIELIIIAIMYLRTMLPNVGYWDTAEFQTIPYSFDIGHPPGYPTYIIFGRIFLGLIPLESIAWRMNLFSLFAMLASLILAYLIILKITKDKIIGLITLPLLALGSSLYWQMALQADPHSLHLFLSSLSIYFLINALIDKKFTFLYLASLSIGLSLGNHLLSIFYIPSLIISSFLLLIHTRAKLAKIVTVVGMFLIGVSSYLLLFVISLLKPPFTVEYRINNLENFFRHVAGKDFQGMMSQWTKGDALASFVFYFELLKDNIPIWLLILSIAGICYLIIKQFKLATIFILPNIFVCLFSLNYQNGFLERYFLVNIWSIIILGSIIVSQSQYWSKKIWIPIYFLIYILSFSSLYHQLPINYKKNDQSKNNDAYNYAKSVLTNIPANSSFFTWWSYATPLWYLQKVENINPEAKIINLSKSQWNEQIVKLLQNGEQVYLSEHPDDYPNIPFTLINRGSIYQAELKQ